MRQDEFDEGHIPGAICIPNESIVDSMPSELPDLEQVILVYCRSGRRSKEAAQNTSAEVYHEKGKSKAGWSLQILWD